MTQRQHQLSLFAGIVAMATCLALALAGLQLTGDRAAGAEPRGTGVDAAQQAKEVVCGPLNEVECKKKRTYAKQRSKAFKKGKLGNAKGFEFPRKVKKMIRKKMKKSAAFRQQALDLDWWDYPFHSSRCLAYGGLRGGCDQAASIRRNVARGTVKVFVGCGGQAIIGAYFSKKVSPKKGYWGAGIGMLQCLYGKFWDHVSGSGGGSWRPVTLSPREPS